MTNDIFYEKQDKIRNCPYALLYIKLFMQLPKFFYYFSNLKNVFRHLVFLYLQLFRVGKFSPILDFWYLFSGFGEFSLGTRLLILFFKHGKFLLILIFLLKISPIEKIFFSTTFSILIIFRLEKFSGHKIFYAVIWTRKISFRYQNFCIIFPAWKRFSSPKFLILFFQLGKFFPAPDFYTSFPALKNFP